jgi:hypothetical protein
MKNLFNVAVNELVERANKELKDMRKDIDVLVNKGDKINVVCEGKVYLDNIVYRLNILKDKFAIDFPEDIEELKYIEKAINVINIQAIDLLNIANEAGNEILELEC